MAYATLADSFEKGNRKQAPHNRGWKGVSMHEVTINDLVLLIIIAWVMGFACGFSVLLFMEREMPIE